LLPLKVGVPYLALAIVPVKLAAGIPPEPIIFLEFKSKLPPS